MKEARPLIQRHIKRIEARLQKIKRFLSASEVKLDPSGQEVQSNITDAEL